MRDKNSLSKVYILILNWNGWQDTIECLESLQRITYPNYQIIVVDNGSTNSSMERIKAWAEGKQEVLTPEPSHPLYYLSHPSVQKPIPYIEYDRKTAEAGGIPEKEKLLYNKLPNGIPHPMILIQTGNNLGFAGGNNVGIRYALENKAYYIFLLNNDTIFIKPVLEKIINFAESDKKIGVVGSKLVAKNGEIQESAKFITTPWSFILGLFGLHLSLLRYLPNKTQEVGYVIGAAFLIKREVISDIGFLDERFFLYAEDKDWCFRAHKDGWKVFYYPEVKIIHKGGASGGIRMIRQLYLSNLHFFKKYYSSFWVYILRPIIAFTSFVRGIIGFFSYFVLQKKDKKDYMVEFFKLSLSIWRL